MINKVSVEHLVELVEFELPVAKSGVQMINPNDIDTMVAVFKSELKII